MFSTRFLLKVFRKVTFSYMQEQKAMVGYRCMTKANKLQLFVRIYLMNYSKRKKPRIKFPLLIYYLIFIFIDKVKTISSSAHTKNTGPEQKWINWAACCEKKG